MYGLTQAELAGDRKYNPIDALFSPKTPVFHSSTISRDEYLEIIVRGRFPAVLELTGRSRARWFSTYVEQLVEHDVVQLSAQPTQPGKLRSVLRSCAVRTAQQLNKQATATDAQVDFRTSERALALLEDLSIVLRVPAWSTGQLKRLIQAPKVYIGDPGMAAYLLDASAATLSRSAPLIGPMFETFVVTELATHIETAAEETRLFHLRDRRGREVDVVLESRGLIGGLEVKSSTRVDRSDAKGLLWLRDELGDKFHFGAVLYSGSLPFQLEEPIWALPISSLWRSPKRSPLQAT